MISFGALNIVAHPHPAGTYRRIFEIVAASKKSVNFFGDKYAKLSPISETRDGIFTGRLATWTEVNKNDNAINTQSLEEVDFNESGVVIPQGVGLSAKVFEFAFNEKSHTLVFEIKNDLGHQMSINRAQKAFEKILKAHEFPGVSELDVYVKTQKNVVAQILELPKLRKLEIDLRLPNPDDLSEEHEDLLREMEEMQTKTAKVQLIKQNDADALHPSERYQVMADIAKDNGSVVGYGKNEDGENVILKTSQYPIIYRVTADEDSGVASIRRIAESA